MDINNELINMFADENLNDIEKDLERKKRLKNNPFTPGFSSKSKLIHKDLNRVKKIKAFQKIYRVKKPKVNTKIKNEYDLPRKKTHKRIEDFDGKFWEREKIVLNGKKYYQYNFINDRNKNLVILVEIQTGKKYSCPCGCIVRNPLHDHVSKHILYEEELMADKVCCKYCKIPLYISKSQYKNHLKVYHSKHA